MCQEGPNMCQGGRIQMSRIQGSDSDESDQMSRIQGSDQMSRIQMSRIQMSRIQTGFR